MGDDMVMQLEAIEALKFLEQVMGRWRPGNGREGNFNKVLRSDTVFIGTNGKTVELPAGTLVTVYQRKKGPAPDQIMASCFTMPMTLRKSIINIYPDGAVVEASCHKRRPTKSRGRSGPTSE